MRRPMIQWPERQTVGYAWHFTSAPPRKPLLDKLWDAHHTQLVAAIASLPEQ
jgi:hypothetical protein